jgi:hypothetical protein
LVLPVRIVINFSALPGLAVAKIKPNAIKKTRIVLHLPSIALLVGHFYSRVGGVQSDYATDLARPKLTLRVGTPLSPSYESQTAVH